MNINAHEYLGSLGLIPAESKIYIELLKNSQPATVLEISATLDMPRTTVHENIESLIEKGLVKELRLMGKRKLKAEQPFVLQIFLEEQQINLKKKFLYLKNLQKKLPNVIEQLETDQLSYS